jgi:hypothetical protein
MQQKIVRFVVWVASALATPVLLSAQDSPKLSFVNDVVPVFTMAGCAGSNCHGSIRGQHGFKLSLFGYEPPLDFKAITDPDAHRIDLKNPEQSLILLKPTFQKPHGGGKRFEIGSLQYQTILDWIRQGASFDSPGSPRIQTLTVTPSEQTLVDAGSFVNLKVVATYSNGLLRDMTRLVQYSANDPSVVEVNSSGEVKALRRGETTVMVRTLGQAVGARIEVAGENCPAQTVAAARGNYIDQFVFTKLSRLCIKPSELSGDSDFLRRVYIDAIGTLPTEEEAAAFVKSTDPGKRAKVVDALLERPEFNEFQALQFSELFRSGIQETGSKGSRIFYEYLRTSFREHKPYDVLVRELVTSQGAHWSGNEPSSFYHISTNPEPGDHATNISQLFLGVRLECARCHNHPYERWTQNDFYGFAAFFARVGTKEMWESNENADYYKEEGQVINPATRLVAKPKYPGGVYEEDDPDSDIREKLARWITAPDNPFFARVTVNRVWKHFFDVGLVEPVDDFRVTNPPSNPKLLDALAKDFVQHGFDLRAVMRSIMNSRVYQLSAQPTPSNRDDRINYSHYYMRRLMAESLLDGMAQVTGVQEKYAGHPLGTRAIEVHQAYLAEPNYALQVFGRPDREKICDRDQQPSLVQVLHLISGDTIQRKITAPDSRLKQWLAENDLTDNALIDRIYMASLTRTPSLPERTRMLGLLEAPGANRENLYQDLLWAVFNSKEFLYNH